MVLISISASNINLHDDVYVDWQWVVSRDFFDKVKFMFSFEEIILNYVTFVDIFLIFLGLRWGVVPVRCTVVNHGKKALNLY